MLTTDDIGKLTDLIRFVVRDELQSVLHKMVSKKQFFRFKKEFNELKDTVAIMRKELDTEHALRYEVVKDHEGRIKWLENQFSK